MLIFWLMFWYLLECSPSMGMHNTGCEPGVIILEGLIDYSGAIGHIQFCDRNGKWREVCNRGWDENDTKVVCRQLGFSDQGAQFCNDSCNGESNLNKSISGFNCMGTEERLINCIPSARRSDEKCRGEVGVICISTSCQEKCSPEVKTITSCTSSYHTPSIPLSSLGPREAVQQRKENHTRMISTCAALGGGLGALASIMAIGLVGVVLGWVWSCNRRKKSNISTSHIDNPTYSPKSPPWPHSAIEYSSAGPHDISEATYEAIDHPAPTDRGWENPRQQTEKPQDYEVPIQTRNTTTPTTIPTTTPTTIPTTTPTTIPTI